MAAATSAWALVAVVVEEEEVRLDDPHAETTSATATRNTAHFDSRALTSTPHPQNVNVPCPLVWLRHFATAFTWKVRLP